MHCLNHKAENADHPINTTKLKFCFNCYSGTTLIQSILSYHVKRRGFGLLYTFLPTYQKSHNKFHKAQFGSKNLPYSFGFLCVHLWEYVCVYMCVTCVKICSIIKLFPINPVFSRLSLGSIFSLFSNYLLHTYLKKEYFILPQPKQQRS